VVPNAAPGPWYRRPWVYKAFAWSSVLVLAVTTVYWTVLSARLHEANADQLIDAYLFEDASTFQGALFPGAHTFLVKWPVFAMMSLFGHGPEVFMAVTILMVLATVGVLVYLLRRIEPRPLPFGLLCLALSSVLLLIPAQPYEGALLPANLAMSTTRNLEYALFIVCAYWSLQVVSLRSRRFWLLVALMSLLIASDKLFAVLAVGSGMILLILYLLFRRRAQAGFIARWLALGIAGFAGANILLFVLSGLGVTQIVNESNSSPFPLITSLQQLVLGIVYGIGAVMTNFGANPAHGAIVVRDIPGAVIEGLKSPAIIAYIVNGLLLVGALYAAVRQLLGGSVESAVRLSSILFASVLAAMAVFILTDHYYPVDSRYLAVELFALFIALAAYARGRRFRPRLAVWAVPVFVAAIGVGMAQAWQEYTGGQVALAARTQITRTVAGVIDSRHIQRLIGNYWDVTPVKAQARSELTIAPVSGCDQPLGALNSREWFKRTDVPSAFLAVRDVGAPTYNGCSLARISTLYGVPDDRVHVETGPARAKSEDPRVLLLLYPNGTRPLKEEPLEKPADRKVDPKSIQTSLAPRKLAALSGRSKCAATTLNVVAHEDDDILFMNPDVHGDILAGRCIRTIYLTAGDAGESTAYWQGREKAAKAAYADMYGVPDVWQDDREQVGDRFVAVSYLEQRPQVSLIFLRLPDGNIHGGGFSRTQHESLGRLLGGALPEIHTVEQGTGYTAAQLTALLSVVMAADQPDIIRGQNPDHPDDGDHSDHHAAGMLVRQAAAGYAAAHTVASYAGYPIAGQPANLPQEVLDRKQQTFLAYAKYDGAVCQSVQDCQQTYTYGSYMARQYRVPEAQPTAVAEAAPAL
jgi:GlcNAc-PI de-N-acetylase